MKFLPVLFLSLLCLCIGCTGDTGPMGPAGPPGPGTITIYEGDVPIQGEQFGVDVPEADIENLPLIAVYIRDSADTWLQLSVVESGIALAEFAIIQQGLVRILSLSGIKYRIIVIQDN